MDKFVSPVAPFTLLLPETIPVCAIGEPIASITAEFAWARASAILQASDCFIMPVAKKKTTSADPPTKSTGKRQPTGTTHFQLRPNQFGCGMGGGGGAGSMNEAEARRPNLKSELVLRFHAGLVVSSNLLCHVERKSRHLLLFSCKN